MFVKEWNGSPAKVAVLLGLTSRGQKMPLSITKTKFFKHCLPGIVRTAGYDAHNFVVYIAIDRDDTYWTAPRHLAKIKDFEAPRNVRFKPVVVSGGTFVKAINEVAKIAYRDGMQYFLRINADSELLTPRWATMGIRALQRMNHRNVGVIGPLSYNDRPDIFTHDMTSRAHLEIFNESYYPKVFSNWYIDDWISSIYGKNASLSGVLCPCEKDNDCIITFNCTDCGNAIPLPPKCDLSAGKCLNPYRDGCFRDLISKLDVGLFPMEECIGYIYTKRICIDGSDRKSKQCDTSPVGELFRGQEIYIAPQNWLSSNLVANAAQIFMVEYMKYPVLYRYGNTVSKGFYEEHIETPVYARNGVSTYNLDAIENGGCINSEANIDETVGPNITCKCTDPTKLCAHVQFEYWESIASKVEKMAIERKIERGGEIGFIGRIALMIPKWAVDTDHSLATYRGFRDREKMARLFKRPVNWTEYCDRFYPMESIKSSLCPPLKKNLGNKYFHRFPNNGTVVFHGYFDGNGINNCTLNPTTCIGSATILEKCDWGDFSKLMIPLNNVTLGFHGPKKRGGYTISNLAEIWAAAANRKEMVIMWWWKPDVLFYEYAETEFEMFDVLFPASNKECRLVRSEAYKDLCKNEHPDAFRNFSKASCDDKPQTLHKVLSVSLQKRAKRISDKLFNDQHVPSPIYSFLKDYQFEDDNLQKVFKIYYSIKNNYEQRWKQIESVAMNHALCSVISEQQSEMRSNWKSSVNEGYLCPRVLSLNDRSKIYDAVPICFSILHVIAIAHAVYCMCAIVGTYVIPQFKQQKLNAVDIHQRNYENVLYFGIICVNVEVALTTAEPNLESGGDIHCTLEFAFRYFSTVFIITPLICRLRSMSAIFSSKKVRTYLPNESKNMITTTLAIFVVVMVYLVIWAIADVEIRGPKPLYSNPYVKPDATPLFYVHRVCPVNTALKYLPIIAFVEFSVILYALLLSIQNTYVESIFQDSTSISLAVYNGTMCQIIPTILYLRITTINNDGTINVLIGAFCRFWTAFVLWAFFFNPRFTNVVSKTLESCTNANYYKSIKRIVSAKSDAWTINSNEVVIVKSIGTGAYGTVWLGTYGNTKVAIKKFSKAALSNADFVAELVSLVDLRHKHLVQFVGAILEQSSLVVDFMERGTLKGILQDPSIRLNANQLRDFGFNIALGLEYLHSKGMIHCDMKSENVLVDEHWVCKISDFGLSEFEKDDSKANIVKARSGSQRGSMLRKNFVFEPDAESHLEDVKNVAPGLKGPKGTLLYQPPEVTLGGDYTAAGDIFAFSLILYEIVTRKEPYFDSNLNAYQLSLHVANKNLRPTWVFDGTGMSEAEAEGVQKITELCWNGDLKQRCSASTTCTKLRHETEYSGPEVGLNLTGWKENPAATGTKRMPPSHTDNTLDATKHDWYIDTNNIQLYDPPMDKSRIHESYICGKVISTDTAIYALKLKFRRGKKLKHIQRNEQKILEEISNLFSYKHLNLLECVGCTWNPVNTNSNSYLLFKQVKEQDFESLKNLIIYKGLSLGWNIKLQVITKLCDALEFLHKKNVFHGHLSASEIFCYFQPNAPAKVKLSGIYKNIVKSNKAEVLGDESNFAGWMPPEMLMLEQYSEAGDVFSVGVLLWTMLTNKLPFEGEPVNTINRAIVNDNIRPEITLKDMESLKHFHFYNKETGLGYVDLVNLCWSQKIEDRPPLALIQKNITNWHKQVRAVGSAVTPFKSGGRSKKSTTV
eukprot:g3046.t1